MTQANLIVFRMVKKEDEECFKLTDSLLDFLNKIEDPKKKRFFMKEITYILFRLESLSSINLEYVEAMKKSIQGGNLGCFLLMIGIYCFSKGDNQNCVNYYTQAFDCFQSLEDELFMLLTSRVIIQFFQKIKHQSSLSKEMEKVYQELVASPAFKDIQMDILFENFDRRFELAKRVF